MSITIVSAPQLADGSAKTAASSFSGDEAASLSADFASLLFAQLLPPVEASVPVREKAVEAAAEPGDAASLLAAAGFVPVENSLRGGLQPTAGQTEKPLATLSASLSAPERRVEDKALPFTEALEERPEFAGKPAKIAASAGLSTEMSASETVTENRQNTGQPLVAAANALHNQASAQSVAKTVIETPVHDRGWQEAFSQKIVWLAGNERQSAQITLNPPQMGPIEIALNIDKGNATASFVSANADVRESIEMALPRLREMFAGIGLELGQANVSEESFRQAADNASAQAATRWTGDQAILVTQAGMQGATSGLFVQRSGSGLVDIFA